MHFLLILFSILVLIEKKGASATLGVLEVHNFRGGFGFLDLILMQYLCLFMRFFVGILGF